MQIIKLTVDIAKANGEISKEKISLHTDGNFDDVTLLIKFLGDSLKGAGMDVQDLNHYKDLTPEMLKISSPESDSEQVDIEDYISSLPESQ